MDTLEVISEVLKHNNIIDRLKFIKLKESILIKVAQNKDINYNAQIKRALQIRRDYKFTFWESLCSTFIDNNEGSYELLNSVYHHNYNEDIIIIEDNQFSELQEILEPNINYAITSEVSTAENEVYHIPFIDFHCKKNKLNQKIVEQIINILGIGSGYLLDSGESYHFIGLKLIPKNEFMTYIGKLLMYTPIIDKSWISHQLIEQYCALRIKYKNSCIPKVVKKIA